jgi:heme/copper-type cytochrome/quinol oxidase subunit 1
LNEASGAKTSNTTPNIMKQCRKRPYHLLLLTALIFGFMAAFTIDPTQQLDIILHDTYFIVTHSQIVMLLALIALLLWTLYVLTNKLLYSRTLSWIHIVMSILPLAAIALWQFRPWDPGPHPALRYMAIEDYWHYTALVRLLLLLILAGQLVLPINLLAGLVRHFKKASAGNKN